MEHIYDIDLVKESSPPLLTVTSSEWDGPEWSMQGQYSDPDGEEVSFSMSIDGSNTGSVSSTGNSWATPAIDFRLWTEGEHVVVVEGCDSSGKCSQVPQTVNNSHLFEVEQVQPPPSEEEDGGLLIGGFEPDAKPWGGDGIPSGFEFQLFDEDWDLSLIHI